MERGCTFKSLQYPERSSVMNQELVETEHFLLAFMKLRKLSYFYVLLQINSSFNQGFITGSLAFNVIEHFVCFIRHCKKKTKKKTKSSASNSTTSDPTKMAPSTSRTQLKVITSAEVHGSTHKKVMYNSQCSEWVRCRRDVLHLSVFTEIVYLVFRVYASTLHKEYEHFSEDYSDISTVKNDVDDVKPNLS